MVFFLECVVACVLFTAALEALAAKRREVFVNAYPPVVTEKLRALGIVAEKPPARKSDIIRKLIAVVVFALVIAGGSYFMGAFGRLYYAPAADGSVSFDSIVPQMLSTCLPDILIGVVMILVLSASMSTLSSLVITSASTFVLDFLRVYNAFSYFG